MSIVANRVAKRPTVIPSASTTNHFAWWFPVGPRSEAFKNVVRGAITTSTFTEISQIQKDTHPKFWGTKNLATYAVAINRLAEDLTLLNHFLVHFSSYLVPKFQFENTLYLCSCFECCNCGGSKCRYAIVVYGDVAVCTCDSRVNQLTKTTTTNLTYFHELKTTDASSSLTHP